MAIPTVHIGLLGPYPVAVIDSRIPGIISSIADGSQRRVVAQLEDFIEGVNADGSIIHLLRLGVLSKRNMNQKHFKKDHLLEKCYWQLVQLYRYSTPSRIAEAVPAIRLVLEIDQRVNPAAAKKDVVPLLYLGVGLSRGRENDEEALDVLTEALDAADLTPESYVKNSLWARAELSRLLRRLDRHAEAKEIEMRIRLWILGHPLSMQPAVLKALVADDTEPPGNINHILAHPDMAYMFRPARDVRFEGMNMNMMFSHF